mgnify:CR=1 FL=1
MSRTVAGKCPAGCGETLILLPDGRVWCSARTCERPDAAAEMLASGARAYISAIRFPTAEEAAEADEVIREWLDRRRVVLTARAGSGSAATGRPAVATASAPVVRFPGRGYGQQSVRVAAWDADGFALIADSETGRLVRAVDQPGYGGIEDCAITVEGTIQVDS